MRKEISPELKAQWNYDRNESEPEHYSAGSAKRVWWKCDHGHEWQAVINHKTQNKTGCPYCLGQWAIKGENDLATVCPGLMEEWDWEKNALGPENYMRASNKKVWWKCGYGHAWNGWIFDRTKNGSGCPYCAGTRPSAGENDLKTVCPDLMKEWDFEKNEKAPENYLPASNKKVWWKCKNGHGWNAAIANRAKGTKCPYCTNRMLMRGFNDLAAVNQVLASEWNWEKNERGPEDYVSGAAKKVWWKCGEGHEWATSIVARSRGAGCPYCAGNIPVAGENDFATEYPELLEAWDWEKNKSNPEDYTRSSGKKVWWRCKNHHEWEATIHHRVKQRSCPYCSGKRAVEGKTDFATVYPELALEWNWKKNEKGPENYTRASSQKVWWRCKQGHEWKTAISGRALGTGCPYCACRKAIPGETDIATLFPELMVEWNWEKNRRDPESYTKSSGKKVWWKCKNGHEWRAVVSSRTRGCGCPVCAGKNPKGSDQEHNRKH